MNKVQLGMNIITVDFTGLWKTSVWCDFAGAYSASVSQEITKTHPTA
jgi:hypothetical protein